MASVVDPAPGHEARQFSLLLPILGDQVYAGQLTYTASKPVEVVVFHLLDPDEADFPYTDTATFVDMESGERLTTEPWEIARRYRQKLEAWSDHYRSVCRENLIDYVRLDTRTPFDRALLAYLEKRARLL